MSALGTIRSTRYQHPWKQARKLRVLYVVTQALRGGAQMHLLDLATGMHEWCEVHLACGEEGFLTEACRGRGIPTHIVPQLRRSGKALTDIRALLQTRAVMHRVRPDIVHVHTFKAGFIGRLAAWSLHIPAIYTIHAWLWGTKAVSRAESLLAIPLERLASRWCDKIITVSAAGEERVREHGLGWPDKHVTVHNGITDRMPGPRVHRDEPVIVMVARFAPGKDYDQVIRAFAPLSDRARLVLIGEGDTRPQMEALVRSLRIEDRVDFLGEKDNVPELLEQADIFALGSESEMLPISILEAMRAGLAVVASDVGGVAEAVEDGLTGLLVPKGDARRFSEALKLLIENPNRRDALGRRGRMRFEAQFKSGLMQQRTYRLYVETVRARRGELFEIDISEPHLLLD